MTYDAIRRTFEIEDAIEGEGDHEIARHWHFAEDLEPQVQGSEITVEVGSFVVRLVCAESDTQAVSHRAGNAEEGGWISRRFDRKSPATSVHWTNRITAPTVLRTRIEILERGLEG